MSGRIKCLALWLFVAVGVVVAAAPQSNANGARATKLLEGLSSAVNAMPSYRVEFEAYAGDDNLHGEYAVAGDIYHIKVADMEVFGDGATRYEVDGEKREIIVDVADTTSHNLLNNPTRAFMFLGSDYDAELLSDGGAQAEVRLKPKSAALSESITVTILSADNLPSRIVYDAEGDSVIIAIKSFKRGGEPARFDMSRYEGYEIIDFR